MGTKNLGRLGLLALIYVALMAAAYWYVNKDNNKAQYEANPVINSNLNNGLGSRADVSSGNTGFYNDLANSRRGDIRPVATAGRMSNFNDNNQAEAATNSTRVSGNQIKTASIARQYHDSRFYANHPWRANISYPKDGSLVSSDNGWVTVHGSVSPTRLGEKLFVVVESTTQDPPKIYLQRELQLADDGFWTANVKYGSSGYEYITYVISAPNDLAAETIRDLGEFTQDQLPAGTEIVSRPIINLIQ